MVCVDVRWLVEFIWVVVWGEFVILIVRCFLFCEVCVV